MESQLTNKALMNAFKEDEYFNISQLYLRDLNTEASKQKYNAREPYLNNKYNFMEGMLHNMIIGVTPG
jgi:hypothetical protein